MRKFIFLLASLVLGATSLSVNALDEAKPDEPMPVSVARKGFMPAQAEELAPQFYDVSVAVSGATLRCLSLHRVAGGFGQCARTQSSGIRAIHG